MPAGIFITHHAAILGGTSFMPGEKYAQQPEIHETNKGNN
jgi:hypothetical protein